MKVSPRLPRVLSVIGLGVLGSYAATASAEINLVTPDTGSSSAWDQFEVQFGGSIRAQYLNRVGGADDHSYQHRGYDGGTRFRLHVNYRVDEDLKLLSYAELGVDTAHVLGMDGHYQDGHKTTDRRQVYAGFDSQRYGRLTFGKQNSVYYDTVGVQTDQWDYDLKAQASGVGIDGNYDGSYRTRKSAKYIYTYGDAEFFAGWVFPDDDLHLDNDLDYRRKSGGSLGVAYSLTPDLTLTAAYANTDAEIKGQGDHESYRQQTTGTAITWAPGAWYLSLGGGYYTDFVPADDDSVDDYFASDAYGVEYLVKYTLPVEGVLVRNVQPYVAGDRVKLEGNADEQRNHQVVGLTTNFAHGFRLDLERIFANTSDDEADGFLARARYDF
ncbi:porin [Salinicola avicenniae]|uniref:porin n=1 Tax=Salinicola avicenniae TaxID=2916836 RepID=UPI002073B60D|nr:MULTISPECIES: hypothetical protein [unclassified Salinicola]